MPQESTVQGQQLLLERALWRAMEQFAPPHINSAVHPEDQMFTWSARHLKSADIALSQYYAVALQQLRTAYQLMTWKFGSVANVGAMLDFASGYGRMVRLLVVTLPPSRIWVSDIQADAVAFQEQQYNVHGIVSTAIPELFNPGRSFDCIFVASLFSHLPNDLFHRWLARLHSLLTPDGMLCMSVHDVALMDPSMTMPDSGIFYVRSSEIEALDPELYGTTHVTEAYVQSAILEASGSHSYIRIKRALAYQQDMYVIDNSSTEDFSRLRFEYGPWGSLDNAYIIAPGRIRLAGWASTVDLGQRIATIEVYLDGELVQVCVPSLRRDDVGAYFGESSFGMSFFDGDSLLEVPYEDAAFANCAWECSFLYDASNPEQFLEVVAISSDGARFPLYLGKVDSALR